MDAKTNKKNARKERREMQKEQMKIYRQQIDELAENDKKSQLAFPPILNNGQRKNLHTYAHGLGLKSKSHGKGEDRFLIVYKKETTPFVPTNEKSIRLALSNDSIEQITQWLELNPLTDTEKQNTNNRPNHYKTQAHLPFIFGDTRSKPQITVPPKTTKTDHFDEIRRNLPIFNLRNEILEVIEHNQVIVISGETGSGKTTQVPQYILEESTKQNQPCRIICTQPRRLAATSIATRISQERNDSLGKSVGYQIRLDSRLTATTNLVLTTSGYLLRCLTGSRQEDVYKSITHLIIDEVHEREKVTDFLLIAIRDAIKVNKNLKVILMSATLDSQLFCSYFDDCPVINVPGRMFDVEIKHLDDVLMETEFKSKRMDIYMAENKAPKILRSTQNSNMISNASEENAKTHTISEEDIQFYDECFSECMDQNDEMTFEQIFCLITDENMPVEYMHSIRQRTALGIAAEKGFIDVVIKLLSHGADPNFIDSHGKTAIDYAKEFEQDECIEAMMQALSLDKRPILGDLDNESISRALKQYTLTAYQLTLFNDIDHDLLYHVISYIHKTKPTDGSILVFLPGYDDIMKQKDMIEQRFQANNFQLFVLHSGVNGSNTSEQLRVFESMPTGIRKIILSTNIAETSLTINDVVYVIDGGKVKQLSYDSISESTCLTSTSISKACAKQRAGRAGRIRNGICYRLYSKEQYDLMEQYTMPEILRVPLTEICLNTKMLAGDLSIEEFLLKALQPPSVKNIRQSIELLMRINALDEQENITYLGILLANMPVDCQYGKMILYSIIMRCVDPIVTIVSALSVKDPFMLPLGNDGDKINQVKREFAQNSFSDHQMLLNTYNEWIKQKKRDQFCQDNFISIGNMHMIQGVRKLIMGHLKMSELIAENSARNIKKLNLNSDNWTIVKACLTVGMYPNVCRMNRLNGQIYSKQDKKLLPHISSVLRQRKTKGQIDPEVLELDAEWLIHGEKSRISTFSSIRNVSIISGFDVALFTGPICLPPENLYSASVCEAEVLSDMDVDEIPDDDYLLCDSDDGNLFTSANIVGHDFILKIDDWISFIMEEEEVSLLYGLRQKFATMISRFFAEPITFQMTNKEERMLQILIKIVQDEDRVEKKIHNKKALKQNENATSDNLDLIYTSDTTRNSRQTSDESRAGPAFASAVYNMAIQPEHRRNKKRKNQNRPKKGMYDKFETNRTNFSNTYYESPQPSTSHASAQEMLMRGLNATHSPDIGSLNLIDTTTTNISENFTRTRYFLLTVKNMGHLYSSAFKKVWLFNTPLKYMRTIARDSAPCKIIIFMHLQKVSAICGSGQFHVKSSGQYDIRLDNNISRFKPLYRMEAFNDFEMDSIDGQTVHNICLSMA